MTETCSCSISAITKLVIDGLRSNYCVFYKYNGGVAPEDEFRAQMEIS